MQLAWWTHVVVALAIVVPGAIFTHTLLRRPEH